MLRPLAAVLALALAYTSARYLRFQRTSGRLHMGNKDAATPARSAARAHGACGVAPSRQPGAAEMAAAMSVRFDDGDDDETPNAAPPFGTARRLAVARAEMAAASTTKPPYIIFGGGGSPKEDPNVAFKVTLKKTANAPNETRRTVHRIPPDPGPDRGGGASKHVDVFRVSDGAWLCQQLSAPRRGPVGTSSVAHAYVSGGELKGTPSSVVDVFDAKTGAFYDQPLRMSHPRQMHCAATSLRFDASAGKTSSKPQMPVSSRIYFAAGSSGQRGRGGGLSNAVDVLDDAALRWLNHKDRPALNTNGTARAAAPLRLSSARKKLACAAAGGLVLFAGGVTADGPTDAVDIFDEEQDKFLATMRLPTGRRGYLAAAATESFVAFAGGQLPCPRGSDCPWGDRHPGLDVFDVRTRAWVGDLGGLREARSQLAPIGIDARLLGWPPGEGFALFAGGNAQANTEEMMRAMPGACEGVVDTCKRTCSLGESKSQFMVRRGFQPHMDGTKARYKRAIAHERDRETRFPRWCGLAHASHASLWKEYGTVRNAKSNRHFRASVRAAADLHAASVRRGDVAGNCTGHLCTMWRSPALDFVHGIGSTVATTSARMGLPRFGFGAAAAPVLDASGAVPAVVVAFAGGRWRRRWWPWPSEVALGVVDFLYVRPSVLSRGVGVGVGGVAPTLGGALADRGVPP